MNKLGCGEKDLMIIESDENDALTKRFDFLIKLNHSSLKVDNESELENLLSMINEKTVNPFLILGCLYSIRKFCVRFLFNLSRFKNL
jgi:hypothetical protein